MKEYMDCAGSIVRQCISPDPRGMRALFQLGKATSNPGLGAVVFSDCAKPGNKVTLTFDPARTMIRSFAEATHAVTVNARVSSLAGGTNFLEEPVLDASAKENQIKTTNSGRNKTGR